LSLINAIAINTDGVKEAARRLVNRLVFDALQTGAEEARILFDGQLIQTAYRFDGEWRRQEDMPTAIWPQILRRIRNIASLTLDPQPLPQKGNLEFTILDRRKGEERHYTLSVVIINMHNDKNDKHHDLRIVIPKPVPYEQRGNR
jgi:type II secretory ATPase GspE/PulE/Tfp pilus assembly ATPase PilB-like protein